VHWALTPASVASMSISRKSKPKLASQAVQLVPPTRTQRVGGVVGTRETNYDMTTQRRQRVQSRWCETNGRRSQKLDEQCTTIQQARTEPRHHAPMPSTTQAKEAPCIVKEAGVTGKLRHTTAHLARRVLASGHNQETKKQGTRGVAEPQTIRTHPVHAQTPQPPKTLRNEPKPNRSCCGASL
jgi:hypothetical protein